MSPLLIAAYIDERLIGTQARHSSGVSSGRSAGVGSGGGACVTLAMQLSCYAVTRNPRLSKTQFRPTLWPPQTIPEPDVVVFRVHEVSEGRIYYRHGGMELPAGDRHVGGVVRLTPELVLGGLRALETHDDEAVIDFLCNGVVGRSAAQLGLPAVVFDSWNPAVERDHVLVADVALILRSIQACANHWVQFDAGQSVIPAWQFMAHEELSSLTPYRDDEALCWLWFEQTLNAGLRQVPPEVRIVFPSAPDDASAGDREVGLFSGLCVQLFNVMNLGIPIRECANENCSNVFQRQHGRARKGQYRTEGVLFCSAACARAQSQRELRRRRKQERRGES